MSLRASIRWRGNPPEQPIVFVIARLALQAVAISGKFAGDSYVACGSSE